MVDSCCWWCCHDIPEEEIHMPYKYDDRTNKFSTAGHFCSWGCMKSYAMDRYNSSAAGNVRHLIHMYRKKMSGEDSFRHPIIAAPSRIALKMFGGPMTIEEFRMVGTGKSRIILHRPDETFAVQMIHNCTCGGNVIDPTKHKSMQAAMNMSSDRRKEPDVETKGRMDGEKLHMINSSSGKNDPLRLKRPKPLKRDQNNLEKTLGIIRTSKK